MSNLAPAAHRAATENRQNPSVVNGVVISRSATALSIKPGGSAREVEIAGGIKTHGPGVTTIEQHGAIDTLRITGGLVAVGGGFDKI